MAMSIINKFRRGTGVVRTGARMAGVLLALLQPCGFVRGQDAAAGGDTTDEASMVRGTVVNRVTGEPISRALVYTLGNQYAMMTDDQGRFEFKFPVPKIPQPGTVNTGSAVAVQSATSARITQYFSFAARKPGFLDGGGPQNVAFAGTAKRDVTIYLEPEGMIVGKVTPSDAESMPRFDLELYRQDFQGEEEHWEQAGRFTSWSKGEFRFWGLRPGTYKLVTREQLDRDIRDVRAFGTNEQQFGFPATFYPGTSDFSTAGEIRIAAGQTVEANVSPPRRAYHAVRIPVAGGTLVGGANVLVYPLGHPGPGFSLGFDPGQEAIVGSLPDGSYTVSVSTAEPGGQYGTTNISIRGAPLNGPPLNLVNTSTVTVDVKQIFKSGQSVFGVAGGNDSANPSERTVRVVSLQINLNPVDEFSSATQRSSQAQKDGEETTVEILDVIPGKYRLRATTGIGYVASVLCGGVDLLRQPLLVGLGGLGSPIEMTLRDDGAEVSGSMEEEGAADGIGSETSAFGVQGDPTQQGLAQKPPRYVYFVPTRGSSGQFREVASDSSGSFSVVQLPPGEYLVLGFAGMQSELGSGRAEVVSRFAALGQVIQAAAEQKLQLRVKVIAEAGNK
jgi:hypothetical protein